MKEQTTIAVPQGVSVLNERKLREHVSILHVILLGGDDNERPQLRQEPKEVLRPALAPHRPEVRLLSAEVRQFHL